MKVLLYLEGKSVLEKSGIGRALQHQMHALDLAGIPYTTDVLGDYDVVHINTYGPRSLLLLHAAKRGGKKVIMHGHSTKEDFENSFIGSNLFAPLFGKYLAHMYKVCAGLYFRRKGIEDFVEVARRMPDVRFIWLGSINLWIIPRKIRDLVLYNHPENVEFPGYFKGAVFQGAMSGSDAFFFPSYEETEGIVVLEALASGQHVVLRDIPVYNGWIDEDSAELCHNVDEFVESLRKILDGKVDKREAGYRVAESRSIDDVALQLVKAYQTVLEM